MNLSKSLTAFGLTFALATGVAAQEHPLVINETQYGVMQLLKERLPEGTRVYIATSAAANANDTDVDWELQTSKVDEVSTCNADNVGVQQLRIIALSTNDVKESDYGPLKFTKDAQQAYAAFMEDNLFAEAPEDEKPDELSPEAWHHKYLMGLFADQFELDTGITPVIYTVQIPTSAIEGIDMECGISMQMMEDLGRDLDILPDGENNPMPMPPLDNAPDGFNIQPNDVIPRFDPKTDDRGGIVPPEMPLP